MTSFPSSSGAPSGVLILVVGPSGAGKDALMTAARVAFAADPGLAFARRVVTRSAMAGAEDHDSLTEAAFAAAEAAGAFALAWRAHGLAYGIPIDVVRRVADGVDVVANASRGAVAAAEALGVDVAVIHVTAPVAVLAERIARRGRESAADIAARLARDAPVRTTAARLIEVRNDGPLAAGEAAFVAAIRSARRAGRRSGAR
jgi:phosphonate metabolism protein PhnN/1,5-bisphosphokinase (PRPP-forming)